MIFTQKQLIQVTILCSLTFLFGVGLAGGQSGDPVRGDKLVRRLGCRTCHTVKGEGGGGETRAPELAGIYGKTVEMESGEKVKVTDEYVRESITAPDAKVVKGYPAGKMPPRFAHLREKDLASIVAYIRSLSGAKVGAGVAKVKTEVAGTGAGVVQEKAAEKALAAPVHFGPPLVWIWIFVGFCSGAMVSMSLYFMSRNISWGWITVIVLIGGLGLGGGLVWASYSPLNSHKEFKVEARRFAYDPPIMRVDKGDRVSMTVTSKDVLHGFYLDGYDIDREIRPDETVRFTFIANKEGKYGIRCSHTCGVLHPFMVGTLIVEPNYLFPGSMGLGLGLAMGTFLYVAKKEE